MQIKHKTTGEVLLDIAASSLIGADLSGASLRGADLSGADLSRASLSGASLRGADLRGADLSRASLSGADLSRANLSRASLSGADLRRASLIGADLSGASLRGADLFGANLSEANLPYAPKIESLDKKILERIEQGGKLDMSTWHSCACETTHCRAGWAIVLSGEAGKVLESVYGSAVAGALIYNASTGAVPNFFATYEEALADIKEQAAKQ